MHNGNGSASALGSVITCNKTGTVKSYPLRETRTHGKDTESRAGNLGCRCEKCKLVGKARGNRALLLE
ncbi:hypothetical protein M404DRAFT_308619 [Pisolithus tinctorius Marx 270]|uniref:Uncharacterized protein n=1 Tax=Pisolithus tinctorius Marx 270 TaxID=870435 RepID=A0A0C3PKM1_PISTI|nr:hypothetical protein M404DRAFT_308619 [Pisolithus tinctorius Marx 270]